MLDIFRQQDDKADGRQDMLTDTTTRSKKKRWSQDSRKSRWAMSRVNLLFSSAPRSKQESHISEPSSNSCYPTPALYMVSACPSPLPQHMPPSTCQNSPPSRCSPRANVKAVGDNDAGTRHDVERHRRDALSYLERKKANMPEFGQKVKETFNDAHGGILESKLGYYLGKAAVAHDLANIPRMPEKCVVGVSEDEMHSRKSYLDLHYKVTDAARTHLPKGSQVLSVNFVVAEPDPVTGQVRNTILGPEVSGNDAFMDLLDGPPDFLSNKYNTAPAALGDFQQVSKDELRATANQMYDADYDLREDDWLQRLSEVLQPGKVNNNRNVVQTNHTAVPEMKTNIDFTRPIDQLCKAETWNGSELSLAGKDAYRSVRQTLAKPLLEEKRPSEAISVLRGELNPVQDAQNWLDIKDKPLPPIPRNDPRLFHPMPAKPRWSESTIESQDPYNLQDPTGSWDAVENLLLDTPLSPGTGLCCNASIPTKNDMKIKEQRRKTCVRAAAASLELLEDKSHQLKSSITGPEITMLPPSEEQPHTRSVTSVDAFQRSSKPRAQFHDVGHEVDRRNAQPWMLLREAPTTHYNSPSKSTTGIRTNDGVIRRKPFPHRAVDIPASIEVTPPQEQLLKRHPRLVPGEAKYEKMSSEWWRGDTVPPDNILSKTHAASQAADLNCQDRTTTKVGRNRNAAPHKLAPVPKIEEAFDAVEEALQTLVSSSLERLRKPKPLTWEQQAQTMAPRSYSASAPQPRQPSAVKDRPQIRHQIAASRAEDSSIATARSGNLGQTGQVGSLRTEAKMGKQQALYRQYEQIDSYVIQDARQSRSSMAVGNRRQQRGVMIEDAQRRSKTSIASDQSRSQLVNNTGQHYCEGTRESEFVCFTPTYNSIQSHASMISNSVWEHSQMKKEIGLQSPRPNDANTQKQGQTTQNARPRYTKTTLSDASRTPTTTTPDGRQITSRHRTYDANPETGRRKLHPKIEARLQLELEKIRIRDTEIARERQEEMKRQ